MQAQRIIVIHPGSLNLRIGRASDLNPITILHAVAIQKRENMQIHHDKLLPPKSTEKDILNEFETQRLQVSHAIQAVQVPKNLQQTAKRLRVATPPQQISAFNRHSRPEVLPGDENEKENLDEDEKILFDRDILQLTATTAASYNVHFPIRRGELNLHSGIGGSIQSVLNNLEAIWLYGLKCLGIPAKSLTEYTVVLVIGDIYKRQVFRELVTLLLVRLRFRACFLLQEAVAATFGAGLGYACVVDIGDQKCSISCVEDGISASDTRVRLNYGGGDVTQVFHTLLKKCSFPYKECDLTEYSDAALVTTLKERFCHMNFEVCGAQERTFEIHKTTGKHLRYTIQVGDECIVAPLSLFHTELFNLTGKYKKAHTQIPSGQQNDPEDCFDADFIRETGRRNGRDQMLEGSLPVTGENTEVDDVVVDADEVTERDIGITNNKSTEKDESLYNTPNGQILPLDQAIVRSIERCSSDDMKRKMFGCILLVGGGAKFPGFSKWLEQQVFNTLHKSSSRTVEIPGIEVNVFVKDMDASIIAWKGAAIMSCLESAPELWITAPEWEKYGLRILREKSPFIW